MSEEKKPDAPAVANVGTTAFPVGQVNYPQRAKIKVRDQIPRITDPGASTVGKWSMGPMVRLVEVMLSGSAASFHIFGFVTVRLLFF